MNRRELLSAGATAGTTVISGTLIGADSGSEPFAYARADCAARRDSAALLMRSRTVGGSGSPVLRTATPRPAKRCGDNSGAP